MTYPLDDDRFTVEVDGRQSMSLTEQQAWEALFFECSRNARANVRMRRGDKVVADRSMEKR